MEKKKILMLGANFFQVTAIQRAKDLGYYVITADYLPTNPGHSLADETYNVSTVDKLAILELCKEKKVKGILSYASDVSATTAAFVAEQLGLPTNPLKAVEILTKKNKFRKFMRENKFTMPEGESFETKSDAKTYFMNLSLPVIIKPIDSSGSKGVIKVANYEEFEDAYDEAMSYSLEKKIIIEKFIVKKGFQIDGDGFVKDGEIVEFCVMDQHNNIERNPHAPIGLSTPSIQEYKDQLKARELIQQIFKKLGIKFGAFNFEYIIDKNGEVYILEIGPRNGGNFIPDTIHYAKGIDMVSASIKACVDDKYEFENSKNKVATSYIVHSIKEGEFVRLDVHPKIEKCIVDQRMFVKKGDSIKAFVNGSDSIGAMILEFKSVDEMHEMMKNMWDYIKVVVQ